MAIMRMGGQIKPTPGGVPAAAAQLFHGAGAGFSAPWRGTTARRHGLAAVPVGPGGSRTTTPARGGRARGLGRRRGRVDRFLLRGRRRRGARRRGAARAWRPWGAYGAPARGIGPRAQHTPRARVKQALRARVRPCCRATGAPCGHPGEGAALPGATGTATAAGCWGSSKPVLHMWAYATRGAARSTGVTTSRRDERRSSTQAARATRARASTSRRDERGDLPSTQAARATRS